MVRETDEYGCKMGYIQPLHLSIQLLPRSVAGYFLLVKKQFLYCQYWTVIRTSNASFIMRHTDTSLC